PTPFRSLAPPRGVRLPHRPDARHLTGGHLCPETSAACGAVATGVSASARGTTSVVSRESLRVSEVVPFTDNIRDLSNRDGSQFEFRCERCGNGYRSAFQRDVVQTGQTIARGVGRLLGGSLGNLGYAAESLLDRSTNSSGKDRAMRQAV